MSQRNHHTTSAELWQEETFSSAQWEREIVPRLPEDLCAKAIELKAFQRQREIGSAKELLQGLLAYVYVTHSFQHLGMWSVLLNVADISANAWRARLRKANGWINWLLQEVLATSQAVSPWVTRAGIRRVLLIDGTHFKCRGPQAMVWRIHTAFDLIAGRLTQIKITDTHQAEQLDVFDLQAGDLVITDRANCLRERIAFVQRSCADLVVRFSPHHLPVEDEAGKKIDVVAWLKGRHAPAGRMCSRRVWITTKEQRIPLRWIAVRLTVQQQEAARRRKKRTANKKQYTVSPDTLYLAGWFQVLTTLPAEHWSDQQVLCLYQARWHIELVFKRIKQLLKLQRLRCTTAATAQATCALLFLGWALQEEEGQVIRLAMHDAMQCTQRGEEDGSCPDSCPDEQTHPSWWQEDRYGPLSEWMVSELSMDLFEQQVRGSYTRKRYQACLPRLQRFLCQGHRKRPHLFRLVCRWLTVSATPTELTEAIV